jgi:uncharacterized membrane protein YkvA (DUF1232 family)
MRFARAAAMNERENMDEARFRRDEATVLREFWGKFQRFAAQIPFAEDLLTAYYCAFDRATPSHVRFALVGALAYFISPLDILPDLLPIMGLTDDAAVLAGALRVIWGNIKPEHRDAARLKLEQMKDASRA